MRERDPVSETGIKFCSRRNTRQKAYVASGDGPAAIFFLPFLSITFLCSRTGILSTSVHKSSRGRWGPGSVLWLLFCPPATAGSQTTRPFFSVYIVSLFATLWIIQWGTWVNNCVSREDTLLEGPPTRLVEKTDVSFGQLLLQSSMVSDFTVKPR